MTVEINVVDPEWLKDRKAQDSGVFRTDSSSGMDFTNGEKHFSVSNLSMDAGAHINFWG